MEGVMRMLVTAAFAASVTFPALVAIDTAYAQTKQGYSVSKPRGAARPTETYGGHRKGIDPDPFIQGEILRHRNSGWPD
jgi:hypothetical protein